MPEPITTVGLGVIAAYLGKDGLQKLLGPTADYLGQELKTLVQRRMENLGRIFSNAGKKLGANLEKPGTVPPRVLKVILDEGSFCDDEVAVEYFGGILASSRTELGRDDRGARIAKILDGLSTYQIRSHYLVYSSVRALFSKSGLPFNPEGRPKMELFLPLDSYAQSMEFSEDETIQMEQLLRHAFWGLHAGDLIGDFQYGPQDKLRGFKLDGIDGGIICKPSSLGCELFLWAFGHGAKPLEFIFDERFDPTIMGVPQRVPGAAATKWSPAT